MKRLLSLLILSTAIIGVGKVSAASDIYYTNPNGINLTEKEYNLAKNMFNENFIEQMNEEDYNLLNRLDVNNKTVELEIKTPSYIQSRVSDFLETQAKRLVIAKSCGNGKCYITLANTWKYEPKVKSYDVIGAMFSHTSRAADDQITLFKMDGHNYKCTEYVYASDGIGCSYKLKSDLSEELYIYMNFAVYENGLVYGAYEHATKSVTLNQSKNYNFHINGYGGVFLFNTTRAKDAYDGMDGVSIYV